MTCCIKSCLRYVIPTGECELKRLDDLVEREKKEKDFIPCYHRKFKTRYLDETHK